jgi:hypothetical protein
LNVNVNSGTFFINSTSNNVGIGTAAPNYTLHVVGNEAITGNINMTSAGSCVYLPSGGRLCGNSTCATLYSPNGVGKVEACN